MKIKHSLIYYINKKQNREQQTKSKAFFKNLFQKKNKQTNA